MQWAFTDQSCEINNKLKFCMFINYMQRQSQIVGLVCMYYKYQEQAKVSFPELWYTIIRFHIFELNIMIMNI